MVLSKINYYPGSPLYTATGGGSTSTGYTQPTQYVSPTGTMTPVPVTTNSTLPALTSLTPEQRAAIETSLTQATYGQNYPSPDYGGLTPIQYYGQQVYSLTPEQTDAMLPQSFYDRINGVSTTPMPMPTDPNIAAPSSALQLYQQFANQLGTTPQLGTNPYFTQSPTGVTSGTVSPTGITAGSISPQPISGVGTATPGTITPGQISGLGGVSAGSVSAGQISPTNVSVDPITGLPQDYFNTQRDYLKEQLRRDFFGPLGTLNQVASQEAAGGRLGSGVGQQIISESAIRPYIQAQGDIDTQFAQLFAAENARVQEANVQNAYQARLANAAQSLQAQQFNAQQNMDAQQYNASQALQAALANLESQFQQQQFNASQQTDAQRFNAEQSLQAQLANIEQALQIQQFNSTQGLQAQQYNVDQASQAQQFNSTMGMQAQQYNADQGFQAQQFNAEQQMAYTDRLAKILQGDQALWLDFQQLALTAADAEAGRLSQQAVAQLEADLRVWEAAVTDAQKQRELDIQEQANAITYIGTPIENPVSGQTDTANQLGNVFSSSPTTNSVMTAAGTTPTSTYQDVLRQNYLDSIGTKTLSTAPTTSTSTSLIPQAALTTSPTAPTTSTTSTAATAKPTYLWKSSYTGQINGIYDYSTGKWVYQTTNPTLFNQLMSQYGSSPNSQVIDGSQASNISINPTTGQLSYI